MSCGENDRWSDKASGGGTIPINFHTWYYFIDLTGWQTIQLFFWKLIGKSNASRFRLALVWNSRGIDLTGRWVPFG